MAPEAPLITTVIPTYKRPKLLRRALQSVLNQTFSNFQICVYDNASQDETAQIVDEAAKADKRVKYFCHSRNLGALENFRFGISRVQTPFFSILQDDDALLPQFYEEAISGFRRYPDAKIFGGKSLAFNSEGRFLFSRPQLGSKETFYPAPQGLLKSISGSIFRHLIWNSVLFRSEITHDVKFDPAVGVTADIDFMLNAAARFPMVFSPRPLALLEVHGENIHQGIPGMQIILSWIKILEKLLSAGDLAPGLKDKIKIKFSRQLGFTLFQLWLQRIRLRDFSEAFQLSALIGDPLPFGRTSEVLEKITRRSKKKQKFTWFESLMLNLPVFFSDREKFRVQYQTYSKYFGEF